ncbi:unnamed protein product [Amoebophrya sp. A120]|nr:unnamed protein product [Amoebophrya sp. A120]|eukprot:GSA120T00008815001.1
MNNQVIDPSPCSSTGISENQNFSLENDSCPSRRDDYEMNDGHVVPEAEYTLLPEPKRPMIEKTSRSSGGANSNSSSAVVCSSSSPTETNTTQIESKVVMPSTAPPRSGGVGKNKFQKEEQRAVDCTAAPSTHQRTSDPASPSSQARTACEVENSKSISPPNVRFILFDADWERNRCVLRSDEPKNDVENHDESDKQAHIIVCNTTTQYRKCAKHVKNWLRAVPVTAVDDEGEGKNGAAGLDETIDEAEKSSKKSIFTPLPIVPSRVIEIGSAHGQTTKMLYDSCCNYVKSKIPEEIKETPNFKKMKQDLVQIIGFDSCFDMYEHARKHYETPVLEKDGPKNWQNADNNTQSKTLCSLRYHRVDCLEDQSFIKTWAKPAEVCFIDINGTRELKAVFKLISSLLESGVTCGAQSRLGRIEKKFVVKSEKLYALMKEYVSTSGMTDREGNKHVEDKKLGSCTKEAQAAADGHVEETGDVEMKHENDVLNVVHESCQRQQKRSDDVFFKTAGTDFFTLFQQKADSEEIQGRSKFRRNGKDLEDRYPLKRPVRFVQLDTATGKQEIEICRFHNYDKENGCKRWKLGKCDLDHSHCHYCLQKGHKAVECPLMLKADGVVLEGLAAAGPCAETTTTELDISLSTTCSTPAGKAIARAKKERLSTDNNDPSSCCPYLYVIGGRNRGDTMQQCERLRLDRLVLSGSGDTSMTNSSPEGGIKWERLPILDEARGSHGCCAINFAMQKNEQERSNGAAVAEQNAKEAHMQLGEQKILVVAGGGSCDGNLATTEILADLDTTAPEFLFQNHHDKVEARPRGSGRLDGANDHSAVAADLPNQLQNYNTDRFSLRSLQKAKLATARHALSLVTVRNTAYAVGGWEYGTVSCSLIEKLVYSDEKQKWTWQPCFHHQPRRKMLLGKNNTKRSASSSSSSASSSSATTSGKGGTKDGALTASRAKNSCKSTGRGRGAAANNRKTSRTGSTSAKMKGGKRQQTRGDTLEDNVDPTQSSLVPQPLPTARRLAGVTAFKDRFIFVFGGFVSENQKTDKVDCFDCLNQCWLHPSDSENAEDRLSPLPADIRESCVQAVGTTSSSLGSGKNVIYLLPFGNGKAVYKVLVGVEDEQQPRTILPQITLAYEKLDCTLPLPDYHCFSACGYNLSSHVGQEPAMQMTAEPRADIDEVGTTSKTTEEVLSNSIFVCGGNSKGQPVQKVFRLDLETLEWQTLPDMLNARRRSVCLAA